MAAPLSVVKGKPPTTDIGIVDNNAYYGNLLSEFLETAPELMWPQSVYTFSKMRHDPQIKGVLLAYMMPILRATWSVDPAGCRDEVAVKVADAFGLPLKDSGDEPGAARTQGLIWHRHLKEVMTYRWAGFMPFERRYAYDDASGLYKLDALSPRMPWTVQNIKRNPDGTIMEIKQNTQKEPVPASHLVWYVNDLEGSNWPGISAIRACFAPWLLKQEMLRVHSTSIRRFGMGVPYVEAPPGASAQEVQVASNLASSMRAGETSGMGLPNGYAAKLMGLSGSVPDAMGFLTFLNGEISAQALAGLMDLGKTQTGSRALGTSFLDLFLLCLQSVADEIADVATVGWPGMPGIASDFVYWNWGPEEPCPRVICSDVGEANQATAEALFLLMSYGAITPDPELESWVRTMYRLPQRAPGQYQSARGVVPVPGEPGEPAVAPAEAVAAARAGRGPRRRVMAAKLGHRKLTPTEVKAGFDPEALTADMETVLAYLLAAWPGQVYQPQRQAIADAVTAAVDDGKVSKLASLPVDTTTAAGLIKASMITLADQAAAQMITEAGHQGVDISPAKVKVSAAALGQVADARAVMAGQYMAQQASRKAVQLASGAAHGATVGEQVAQFMDGLSQRSLADQLHGALMAAQNAGRFAAVDAAPAGVKAGVTWVAVELLDENTCLSPGTKVRAARGMVPAEDVRLSDRLLTHRGRWVQPSRIVVSEVEEKLIRVDLGGTALRLTHDHPVLVQERGALVWREAGQLTAGSLMVSESALEGNRELQVPDLLLRQPPHRVAPVGKVRRLAAVYLGAQRMPVGAVSFDDQQADQEVHHPRADLSLCSGAVAGGGQGEANGAFEAGLRAAGPVAAGRAEPAPTGLPGRRDADLLPALLTGDQDRGATACLTAVPAHLGAGAAEAGSAARAGDIESPCFTTAIPRAVGVAAGVGDRHGEVLAALGAALGDVPADFAAGRRAVGVAGGVARRHMEHNPAAGTRLVHDIHLSRVVSVSREPYTGPVYDFTVPDDETFWAEGVLVHNCGPCEAIDGSEFLSEGDAASAYPGGGYALCEGMDRCRGTIMAVWPGE